MDTRFCITASFAVAVCLQGALPGRLAAQSTTSETLHRLFPGRVRTIVKSGYDPDDRVSSPTQGNDDGFTGQNGCEAYRYYENGTPVSVLADFAGQRGVLGLFFRNFWSDAYNLPMLAGENNRTRMWVDGAVAFDMPLWDFFRNPNGPIEQIEPFDGPFTGTRSGGHLTHAQITWNDSFRLGLDDDPFNNAARFHRVAATLASPEGDLPMPDKAEWERIAANPGQWPQQWPHQSARAPNTVQMTVAANGAANVQISGSGTLLEFTCEVPNLADFTDLWARFTWDNAAAPQVELPLRYLGAMIEPPNSFPVHSLLLDNDGARRVTCWFPMPFRQHAKLEIQNRGAQAVPVQVTYCYTTGSHVDPWGYFVAGFHREITGTGEPFQGPRLRDCHGMLRLLMLEDFADNSGRIPDMHMTHLEGDVCMRINGNRGDDHSFDASETSIGRWGWYLTPADRPFVSDTSFQTSLIARFLPNSFAEGRRLMGSTFLFDPVHFVDGIDIVLEHGVQNSSNADYSLVAFFYVKPGAARAVIDELDVGNTNANDPLGEPAHQVQFTAWSTYTQQGSFIRDQFFGTPPVTDSVRHIRDFLRFTVRRKRDAGCGLAVGFRLDRLGGPGLQVCDADVYVDGAPAGRLHVFSHNPVFPWKEGGECEVMLPRRLTDGRSSLVVEVRPRNGSDPLKIARAWVYEYTE